MSALPHEIQQLLHLANVYLLTDTSGGKWLIDSGYRLEWWRLERALRKVGVKPSELSGLLLTHRHSDHAGNAWYFQQKYGVRLYAHRADAEILAGRATRGRLRRQNLSIIAGVFGVIENRWPAPLVEVDEPLDDGDLVGELEVHWVPGHTEGSIFLHHPPTNSLFTGDNLITAHPPLVIRPGLCLTYASFTVDMDQARTSVAAFFAKKLPYKHVFPGHGKPLANVEEEVRRFVASALPSP
jgi:glyoxylase-like metal-dependent hydrolase (beta-lactamase superfamily II)